MQTLDFVKVEGTTNDFLLVDLRALGPAALEAEIGTLTRLAPRLCHRRTGVGADGLLVVAAAASPGAAARMIVINHDGSRPEMCGNGLRCVAHHVAGTEGELIVDTDAGPLRCAVTPGSDPDEAVVSVWMGPARDLGSQRPAAGAGRDFAGVSMGNPHAVNFVGEGEDPEALARRLGPGLERDPAYPERTNVEFARIDADGALTLWVWERGCGITGACGTGACATAAAAVWSELAPAGQALELRLPGGPLTVTVPADRAASLVMTGPARRVFSGAVRR